MNQQTKPKNKEEKCCICSEPIKPESNGWEAGHNAYPFGYKFANRCCDQCNWNIVIPTRIELSFTNSQNQYA